MIMEDEQETPVDDSQTLREALEEAFDAQDEVVAAEEAPAEEEVVSEADEPEELELEESTDAPTEDSESDAEEVGQEIDCTAFCRTEEERAAFAELPRNMQEVMSERYSGMESDYKSKLETNAENQRYADGLRSAFQPYEAMLRAEGATHEGAIQNLLDTSYKLRNGTPQQKAELFDQLARQYGVDHDLLSVEDDVFVDPQIRDLQSQIADQNTTIQKMANSTQQEQNDAATRQVEEFMNQVDDGGTLLHPHFVTVQPDILALINSGQATTLEQAYEKALWINPETSSVMQKSIRDEALASVAKEKQSKVDAAKKAGGIAPGSSAVEPTQVKTAPLSLHDELAANWEAMQPQH
jgi:hypothetical protein